MRVCVCVCVCERERDRESRRNRTVATVVVSCYSSVRACVRVCMCVCADGGLAGVQLRSCCNGD